MAGCGKIGDKYRYLGGWFNYMGNRGYNVHVLESDSPEGPFYPDVMAYRLCENTNRWVSLWARLCRGEWRMACQQLHERRVQL